MKILVTGGAGFLGSWLVESLLADGHAVVSVDNMIGGYDDNITQHPCHEFVKLDVLDLDGLSGAASGCDIIYHTAALAYEGLSVFSPSLVTENIIVGSTNVATAAARCGVKRVINCSSMARYGANRTPFTENMPPQPEDPYGVAKVAAEMQMELLGRVHGFELVNCVPHNIIGPRQRYNDPFRNVASIMVNLMLQGRQPIVYGDGGQVRCFSFVQDVLSVMMRLVDHDLTEHGERFNVGPDEGSVTINELARRIAALLNFDLHIQYHDPRPCEVLLATCSADKIRRVFNYSTSVTLDEGLQSIIDYIRKRGVRSFDYHLPIEIENAQLPRAWKDRLF